MLLIENKKGYDEVVEFAKRRGVLGELESRLQYLGGYACKTEMGVDETRTVCVLSHDFAPYSWGIRMYRRKANITVDPKNVTLDNWRGGLDRHYDFMFNGGLIYYGPGESGVSGPQFSVRNGSSHETWEINT